MDLLTLYLIFFRIGAVTFGGGYAMLPILRSEIVNKRNWLSEEEIMDYYALSQGLPGIIAVNVALFIGYRRRKKTGAIVSALGMVSPCIIIISIIAMLLTNFQDNIYVRHALNAISICVCALIFDSVISLWKKGVKDKFGLVLCILIIILNVLTPVSPIILVVGSALLGIAMKSRKAE